MAATRNHTAEPDNPSGYFHAVARSAFDDYFRRLGVTHIDASQSTLVRYSHPDWFVDVLFLPSDGPRYCPRVEVGPIPEPFVDPQRNRVDVLYTVPTSSPLRRYTFLWEYRSQAEQESALIKVRDQIIDVYTTPFLFDVKRLRDLVADRKLELDQQYDKEVEQHNDAVVRQRADQLFRMKDYHGAFEEYKKLETRVSQSELARIEFARRSIAQNRGP